MTDWKHITLKVAPSEKQEWKEFVEEHPEVTTMTGLIRTSIVHEQDAVIGEEETGGTDTQTPTRDERVGEVIEGMEQIQTTLESVLTRLSALEHDEEVTGDMDTQKAVMSVLPTPPQGEMVDVPGEGKSELSGPQPPEFAKTVADITAEIPTADESDVEQALERLQDATGLVRSGMDRDGEQRIYWRRE